GGLQTRRGVDDVPDCRAVLDLARADVAQVGSAEVKTDAELYPRSSFGVARRGQQSLGVGCHVLRRLTGENAREVERHHLIAYQLVDARVLTQDGDGGGLKAVQQRGDSVRRLTLGERSETTDVGEQDA